MSQAELLKARDAELMTLIRGFRETTITEFFMCPECDELGGVRAEVQTMRPFDIDCHCLCGYDWVAPR